MLSVNAEPLLALFKKRVYETFEHRVVSLFKFGSLGEHGDFSLCSDVDVVLMLDQLQETDEEKVNALWEELKKSELEYADRLSLFWSSYSGDDFECGRGRFPPLDRLDLIRHAELMTGDDRRKELSEPTHEALVTDSAGFISAYMLADGKFDELTKNQEKILEKGARYFTKFVLFPVRLIFTLDKPGVIGSNYDAVDHCNKTWSKDFPPEVISIVNIAYVLRNTQPEEKVLLDMEITEVTEALFLLYAYCMKRYYDAVLALNCDGLAEQLKKEINRFEDARARHTKLANH